MSASGRNPTAGRRPEKSGEVADPIAVPTREGAESITASADFALGSLSQRR
jgi:hypothetical protein